MISKSIVIPLAMVVFATIFISTNNGNEYVFADPSNNDVKINPDSKYSIDCDEYDTGTNGAICTNEDSTITDGVHIAGENNKVVWENKDTTAHTVTTDNDYQDSL